MSQATCPSKPRTFSCPSGTQLELSSRPFPFDPGLESAFGLPILFSAFSGICGMQELEPATPDLCAAIYGFQAGTKTEAPWTVAKPQLIAAVV